jgi:hypothetical protein
MRSYRCCQLARAPRWLRPPQDKHATTHSRPTITLNRSGSDGDCHGVDVKEVRGKQPAGLNPQEGAPVRVHLAWCWTDPMDGEDAANRAGPGPMPETEQLALDASMPPTGVLPSQPQDQVADLVVDAGL